MTMRPDDVADLFGLPPLPASPPPSGPTAQEEEAAEAALAAELALTIESGGVAGDAPDSRTDRRVPVSWPARMTLPGGRVIELTVRNISEAGMGLVSAEPTPAHTVVDFAMDVPSLEGGGQSTRVAGTIRTTYTVAHGAGVLCGGTWVRVADEGRGLVNRWVARLRR